ncbi:SDR family oxidoreductase [Kitasatospora sp. NPDC101157]|uniref:SDR family oxidoreductase n=1 Tax=Kitasatospora sp. NPDC101157 TaxID=3364098 RepID=UPI00382AFDEB
MPPTKPANRGHHPPPPPAPPPTPRRPPPSALSTRRRNASAAASICGTIEGLVRAPAVEPAPIRVSAVRAGTVGTALWYGFPEADRERLFAGIAGTLPLGRIAEPEEVAESSVHLLNQRSATGTVITVDGGILLA